MNTWYLTKKKSEDIDLFLFVFLWLGYITLTLLLFHRQTVNYAGNYESDMETYVLYVRGVENGIITYPLMFWMARLLSLFFPTRMSLAFAVTILNSLTPLALKVCGGHYIAMREGGNNKSNYKKVYFTLLLFASLLVSMLFWPFSDGAEVYRYKGVFSPNPFHNATYLAARGFSVIAFFLYLELIESLNKKEDNKKIWKKYVSFSTSLLLCTMTKPSFTLGFGIAAGIWTFIHWMKRGIGEWKRYMYMLLAVIPTILDLLYQYSGVFTGKDATGTELGIGFGWLEAWHSCTDHVGISLILGLAFPILVFLCNMKEVLRRVDFGFSWVMMLVNFLLVACLYEKGWRIWHMNFAWGYMYGMFFVFICSALLLFDNTFHKKQQKKLLLIQWGGFLLHLVCGMIYFIGILMGGRYI